MCALRAGGAAVAAARRRRTWSELFPLRLGVLEEVQMDERRSIILFDEERHG